MQRLFIVLCLSFALLGSPAKALTWFAKVAAQGSAKAQRNLGMLYYDGLGVAMDRARAGELFQQTAAVGGGVGKAEFDLGRLH
jgi:TPR repeat protein